MTSGGERKQDRAQSHNTICEMPSYLANNSAWEM